MQHRNLFRALVKGVVLGTTALALTADSTT